MDRAPPSAASDADVSDAHAAAVDDVLASLAVDPATGLPADEVERRRAEHGRNELGEESGTPWWQLLCRQVADAVIVLLLGRCAALVRARARTRRDEVMRQAPRDPREPVIDRAVLRRILGSAVLVAGVGLAAFGIGTAALALGTAEAQTVRVRPCVRRRSRRTVRSGSP